MVINNVITMTLRSNCLNLGFVFDVAQLDFQYIIQTIETFVRLQSKNICLTAVVECPFNYLFTNL